MTGGVSRLVGPLAISRLYAGPGPRAAWLLEIGVLLLMVLLWLCMYGRMTPLVVPADAWLSASSVRRGRSGRASADGAAEPDSGISSVSSCVDEKQHRTELNAMQTSLDGTGKADEVDDDQSDELDDQQRRAQAAKTERRRSRVISFHGE